MKKILFGLMLCVGLLTQAQRNWDAVEITSERLADNLYVLYGSGGNMGLAIGDQFAYLIDDQFAPLSDKILGAIRALTDKPLRYVVNTHWHGDHAGGNAPMAQQGATLIAHENVRKRMGSVQWAGTDRETQPAPFEALSRITFNEEMTVYLDAGHSMHIMHVNPSHTDGDSYVYFPEANVIHMGDNFISGYPFIDIASGGDIDGLVQNMNMALFIVDDQTKIIRGHGGVAGRAELQAFRDMIDTIRMRVKQAKDAGKTLEEVQQMGLTSEWDAQYDKGFINAQRLLEAVYSSVD
ncbi:MBL fold metallo-hydrolase [Robiginitalea sp. M366]|uniref:MBL fold metallo-hydrolase n=1 Tax=Robiginitalea aestuariiviva TaxID=3036903 RepID=UPI00240D5E76|nr:MBL fold metallo-hydrolase [Robiginitalea aestuariiviva]MDG1570850.1 MBL fold metallo-hydrolase [Robiginitalea aestuariiviva]